MDTVIKYDIDSIREEAIKLVKKGIINRQQPIYTIFHHIPASDFAYFEQELEKHEYLLRDRIIDLIGYEDWRED